MAGSSTRISSALLLLSSLASAFFSGGTLRTFKVQMPIAFSSDVTASVSASGRSHSDACEECARLNSPCTGTFVACRGCCDFKSAARYQCKDFIDYYKDRNSISLHELDEVGFDVEERRAPVEWTASVVRLDTIKVEHTPVLMKFHCDNRSSSLLKQCCDHCESQSKHDDVRRFVSCMGCQTRNVQLPNKKTKPWIYAGKYDNFSMDIAERTFESFIEQTLCSPLETDASRCPTSKPLSPWTDCTTSTTTTTSIGGTINPATVSIVGATVSESHITASTSIVGAIGTENLATTTVVVAPVLTFASVALPTLAASVFLVLAVLRVRRNARFIRAKAVDQTPSASPCENDIEAPVADEIGVPEQVDSV